MNPACSFTTLAVDVGTVIHVRGEQQRREKGKINGTEIVLHFVIPRDRGTEILGAKAFPKPRAQPVWSPVRYAECT